MTVWDNIYKNYQRGGEAWATLSGQLHPAFKDFIEHSDFKLKRCLDIGCGNGRYLKLLKAYGFKTDGLDSSETAIGMTRANLDDDSRLYSADMYSFQIPKQTYDLIISIAAIHHGTKDQIKGIIDRIFDAISDNGRIFITVPDLNRSENWDTFKYAQDFGNGTFIPLTGPEKGLPHSFYSRNELQQLFNMFKSLQLDLDDRGHWVIQATK